MGARADRPFDIVVYGATGFTGRLVAQSLARAYGQMGLLEQPKGSMLWYLQSFRRLGEEGSVARRQGFGGRQQHHLHSWGKRYPSQSSINYDGRKD